MKVVVMVMYVCIDMVEEKYDVVLEKFNEFDE